jgi:hypothetical protein
VCDLQLCGFRSAEPMTDEGVAPYLDRSHWSDRRAVLAAVSYSRSKAQEDDWRSRTPGLCAARIASRSSEDAAQDALQSTALEREG